MGELAKWKMEYTNVIVQETLQDLRAKSVSANNETFSDIWQLTKDFDFFAQAFLKFFFGIFRLFSRSAKRKRPVTFIPQKVFL